MKICITSRGDNLESEIDPKFGRCSYFIIWNYENDTILYTYCPSQEQGDVNGYLWTMKPDGSEKVQITFIE